MGGAAVDAADGPPGVSPLADRVVFAYHAEAAAEIMAAVGYDEATIGRVKSLLKKERLKADPETQALEDTICVVFLENYFAEFSAKHEPEKVIKISAANVGEDVADRARRGVEAGDA